MTASCKIIIRDVIVLGTIAASIILMGDKITTAILYSNYFGFIRSIPFSMGWVIFALAAIWLTCRLNGYYEKFEHPFFYIAFVYWLFFFYGEIFTSWGLDISMAAIAIPFIFNCIQWLFISKKVNVNKSNFNYDHFDESQPLHEGRAEMVDLIVSEVKKLYNDKHSFTIGLEGGWGAGKSTLLNAVIEQLRGNSDDHGLQIEVVEFSPWAFPESKNLSVEFLYEIRRVLIKHSFRARFVVNSYINVLASSYNLGPIRMLTNLLFPRESLTEVKRKLSEIICHHKLKLVVVIDDLDRLDKPEIADVFKMLRNTGELANSVYLTAYDRLKIEGMGEFCNGFLDKIINVEVGLNNFNSDVLFETLSIRLQPYFDKLDHNVESRIDLKGSKFIQYIKTQRDVTRMFNSICFRIELLEKMHVESRIDSSYVVLYEIINEVWHDIILDKNKIIQFVLNKTSIQEPIQEKDKRVKELYDHLEEIVHDRTIYDLFDCFDYYSVNNTEEVNIIKKIDEGIISSMLGNNNYCDLKISRIKRNFIAKNIKVEGVYSIIDQENYLKLLYNEVLDYFKNESSCKIRIKKIANDVNLNIIDKLLLELIGYHDEITYFIKSSTTTLTSEGNPVVNYFTSRIKSVSISEKFELSYSFLINIYRQKENQLHDKFDEYSFFKEWKPIKEKLESSLDSSSELVLTKYYYNIEGSENMFIADKNYFIETIIGEEKYIKFFRDNIVEHSLRSELMYLNEKLKEGRPFTFSKAEAERNFPQIFKENDDNYSQQVLVVNNGNLFELS